MDDVTLVTGAAGEMGSALIRYLAGNTNRKIVAFDLATPAPELSRLCADVVTGNVLDLPLLRSLFDKHEIVSVFHLAAVLSSGAERDPVGAEDINVGGTINLLNLSQRESAERAQTIQFIFPSTIAIYGLTAEQKAAPHEPVREDQYLHPIGMYGINKAYCEELGVYFNKNYALLTPNVRRNIDFRAIRFPGIISAESMPSGGTSDYGPAMLHSAAQGAPYACYVRKDSTLPFMVMPDAVKALVDISNAPVARLKQRVYNVNAFSASAGEIEAEIRKYFPACRVSYDSISIPRQAIVDSWPDRVDDSAARRDWGWKPNFDFGRAFAEYLVPSVKERYANPLKKCSNH